jgi:hypothetical protein
MSSRRRRRGAKTAAKAVEQMFSEEEEEKEEEAQAPVRTRAARANRKKGRKKRKKKKRAAINEKEEGAQEKSDEAVDDEESEEELGALKEDEGEDGDEEEEEEEEEEGEDDEAEEGAVAFHQIDSFAGAHTMRAFNDYLEERPCANPQKISNCRQCKRPVTKDGFMIGAKPLTVDEEAPAVKAQLEALRAQFSLEIILLAARQALEAENPLPDRTFGMPVVQSTTGSVETAHSFCGIPCMKRYSHVHPKYNAPEVDGLITDMGLRAGLPLDSLGTAPDEGLLCHQGGPLTFDEYGMVDRDYTMAVLDSRVFERRPATYQFVERGREKDVVPRYRRFLHSSASLTEQATSSLRRSSNVNTDTSSSTNAGTNNGASSSSSSSSSSSRRTGDSKRSRTDRAKRGRSTQPATERVPETEPEPAAAPAPAPASMAAPTQTSGTGDLADNTAVRRRRGADRKAKKKGPRRISNRDMLAFMQGGTKP